MTSTGLIRDYRTLIRWTLVRRSCAKVGHDYPRNLATLIYLDTLYLLNPWKYALLVHNIDFIKLLLLSGTKMPTQWAWPRSRDRFQNFGTLQYLWNGWSLALHILTDSSLSSNTSTSRQRSENGMKAQNEDTFQALFAVGNRSLLVGKDMKNRFKKVAYYWHHHIIYSLIKCRQNAASIQWLK